MRAVIKNKSIKYTRLAVKSFYLDGNISVLEEDLKTQRISCDGLKTELEIQQQSYLARQKELNSLQSHLNVCLTVKQNFISLSISV